MGASPGTGGYLFRPHATKSERRPSCLVGVDSLGLCAALAAVILLPLLACCVPTRLEAERDALSARWLFLRRRWHFADMLAADRYGPGLGEAGVIVRMRRGQALALLTVTRGNLWRNSAALWSSVSTAHRLEALLNEAIAESGAALGRPAVAARVGTLSNATSVLPR